jgi:GNAT superfamily N-acetyltransferase
MKIEGVEIREESRSSLANYASVPIAFEVCERLSIDARESGLVGLRLSLERVALPYVKDYDAQTGNHPTEWAHLDLAHWGILSAWRDGARAGGVVIAWRTANLEVLDGRTDLAFLWDIRVSPPMRGKGIGAALFRAAERWARSHGAQWLKIETQNVNVPACRFYARQGCTLGAINRFAYPNFPDEVQLMWYKRLAPAENVLA